MNVSELIAILQTFDSAATVVVAAYNGRSDVHTAAVLQLDGVRAVALRPVTPTSSCFDPYHGARLHNTPRFCKKPRSGIQADPDMFI